jgi:hypothetical protein
MASLDQAGAPLEVRKVLSRNDLGLTGSHQAGVVVPRRAEILAFFPELDEAEKNPRQELIVRCERDGTLHRLLFIHYNGRRHQLSTRDEYRLTGLTRYLRAQDAIDGDLLALRRVAGARYSIAVEKRQAVAQGQVHAIALTSLWEASF